MRSNRRQRYTRLNVEQLEARNLLAFSIVNAEVFGPTLKLVADFNQPVSVASVQAADLQLDGGTPATSFNIVDADTVEFILPALAAGTHAISIAPGAISDATGTGLDSFALSFASAANPQFTVNQNPRLQPGNAPLAAYPGGNLDRVDLLWQTIPAGVGTQDTFTVQYRAVGATAWQAAPLNSSIATNVENRVVRSASITGLSWNANYEYRVRHWRADVIVAQYQSTFHTRLQTGDATPFTFAAYGDSASGAATGFREVQGRINQNNPAFTVLLGDNVYDAGTHQEADARFSPAVNPEAAAWMSSHIDYLGVGNHDIATGAGLPAEQNYSVPIPVAGVTAPAAPPATERPEHSFSWDYGSVHFVTFDTNSLSDATRLDGLLKWVIADLNASSARWKIVYGHHPLAGVPDKPESASDNYYQQVVNRLKAAGVDLLMTGHSHTFSWTYPLTGQVNGVATFANHGANDQFTSGEGLPQLVSGLGGKDIRVGDYSQFPFVAMGFTASTPVPARLGYSQVNVTPNQLTVNYVAADNGAIIDSFTINKDDAVQATSFQEGVNGYSGTVDTFLQQNAPSTSNATATSLKVDSDDPGGTNLTAAALLRFDNLFGSSTGQIPPNASIRAATLQLQVSNGSVNNMNLHRMLRPWTATETWNSLASGVQLDNVEAISQPDTSSGQSQVGTLSFNVLSSVQNWLANPAGNLGWALMPTGADGVDFSSAEGTIKPKLIVNYVIPTGTNTPPTATPDDRTTNLNAAIEIAVLANDTDSNGDFLTVTSVTQPSHGTTVVNALGGVTYTPASGFTGYDRFNYTISDGRGGSSTAAVNVAVVLSTSFQQGLAGYTGTVDTFLQQNSPGANNSAVTPLNIDGDDPGGTGLDVQALLRFDNLFGSAPGQIPPGATLQAATLQLQVTNGGSSLNLHRMLANWSASDTWNSLTGGIQNDGVEALAAADLSTGSLLVGAAALDVLPSLVAWQATPTLNYGWAFLPTDADGVDFDSSEGTIRPKLIVSYLAPPPTLQVTRFVPTATGGVLTFSRALDQSQLNLYDVIGNPFGPADIVFRGANVGLIKGSALVDPDLRRITFVATGGTLPADDYTLTLRSAANGFRDLNGELLDGDADGTAGGDWVQTFTVTPAAPGSVALRLPNFARGPLQPVNVPANSASGLPISFSDGGGITSANFELRYNPALLNISGATVAPGLPPGASVTWNTTTPGVTAVQFMSSTPLPAGTTRFVDLQAAVPVGATYREKHILDLANIVLNGGAIPAIDDDAVQVNAFFGDTSGNGTYSGSDATNLARMVVGIGNGLSVFKLLDPLIIADITGNGGLSGTDTTRVQQITVVVPVAEIPPLPLGAPSLTLGGPDPQLSIPQNLFVHPGGELTIPVQIDSVVDLTGNGLESGELVIEYDATAFDVERVALGSLLAALPGWTLVSRIDATGGRVFITFSGVTPLEGHFTGELVQLQARAKPDAAPGFTAINLAESARDAAIRTQLNEGWLTLIPAPTNGAHDRGVDGRVKIVPASPAANHERRNSRIDDRQPNSAHSGDHRTRVRTGDPLSRTTAPRSATRTSRFASPDHAPVAAPTTTPIPQVPTDDSPVITSLRNPARRRRT